ncbi:MAG: hypothetical protein LLG02_15090 [Pelosinus sp.]|nr:hypothetical protein [Pelosinus sp.]
MFKEPKSRNLMPIPPLDGHAVKAIEDALYSSPTKAILLEINQTIYQLSREGSWLKFSLLTKKKAIKRARLFENITELYNQIIHGQSWRIATCGI